MTTTLSLVSATTVVWFAVAACSATARSSESNIKEDALEGLAKAAKQDPSVIDVVRDARAFAVFPRVSECGVDDDDTLGKGVLYENGRIVGYCALSQDALDRSDSIDPRAQTYTLIIFFEDHRALERFKLGNPVLDAETKAVAFESDAVASTRFSEGVRVFALDSEGMLVSASVGGQRFSYRKL